MLLYQAYRLFLLPLPYFPMNTYLQEGGLPELKRMKSERTKRIYAEGLIETIITKDIARRYKIQNVDGLRRIANHLINNTCQTIDYEQLATIGGVKSENTVRKYVNYLTQAFLVQKIQKFKKNVLICNINRRGKNIIPSGSDTIEVGDNVIIVHTNEEIHNFDDILE